MPTFMQIVDRVVARVGLLRQSTIGPGWLWSNGGWWGNGDRGPSGSWQMNRNSQRQSDLLAFSAVYGCINVIAADISKLPMQVYAVDLEDGTRQLLRSDYYAGLFREPNDYQTGSDFLYSFVQSYLCQGNTYCYCGQRNGRGEVVAMHVLNPFRVQPLISDKGEIFYRVGGDFLAGLVDGQVIPERDMIHHRLTLLPGYPLVGITPIFAASASSALGLRILQDSQQFFGNASRPSGLLSSDQNISDDNKARFKQEWDSAYRGGEIGKTAVLAGGMKWQPLTITAQDAQLIEQLRYSVEDVARVFRVPTFMLGDTKGVTYRNNEQLVRAYLTGCLGFHIEALQQRFARGFDFPMSYELRFDLSAFLRTEADVRFASYQTALNAGWLSANEVRAQEGLDAVEGGDEPRVQMQYVPLSKANGTQPAAPPAVPVDSTEPGQTSINADRVRALLRERLAA